MPRGSSIPYRPEVDTLRAIAVILVILFHARLGIFPGGFIGVDVFFVMSGYLITSIIMAKMDAGTFSAIDFYASRLRRIWPALLFMAVTVAIFCTVMPIYVGNHFMPFFRSLHSTAFFYSNLYFLYNTGYFDVKATNQVFLHTWFLGALAQIFLAYPLVMVFIRRARNRSRAAVVLTAICFLITAVITQHFPSAAFYLSPTRAWEFILGGCLSITGFTPQGQKYKKAFTLTGLALIFTSAVVFNRFVTPAFPGPWALAPCLGTTMFIAGTDGLEGSLKRLFTGRPLVTIGHLAFSLYLWHWPVIVLYRYLSLDQAISPAAFLLLCPIFVGLAVFSYRCIERPSRNKLAALTGKKQCIAYATCLGLITLAVLAVHFPLLFFSRQCAMGERPHNRTDLPSIQFFTGNYAKGGNDFHRFKTDSPCFMGKAKNPPKLDYALYGDSHAEVLATALDEIGEEAGKLGRFYASYTHCTLVNGYHTKEGRKGSEFNKKIMDAIARDGAKIVFISHKWLSLSSASEFVYDNGTIKIYGTEGLKAALQDTVIFFRNSGAERIYIVLSTPENVCEIPQKAETIHMIYGYSDAQLNETLGTDLATHELDNGELTKIFKQIAHEYDYVHLIDPADALCHNGQRCTVIEHGKPLYYDDHHLSYTGAEKLKPMLTDALQ